MQVGLLRIAMRNQRFARADHGHVDRLFIGVYRQNFLAYLGQFRAMLLHVQHVLFRISFGNFALSKKDEKLRHDFRMRLNGLQILRFQCFQVFV